MAKANKCDICGNFYDPKDHGDNDIAWIKTIDKQDICMNSIDLCPQCSKQLKVFLEDRRNDDAGIREDSGRDRRVTWSGRK